MSSDRKDDIKFLLAFTQIKSTLNCCIKINLRTGTRIVNFIIIALFVVDILMSLFSATDKISMYTYLTLDLIGILSAILLVISTFNTVFNFVLWGNNITQTYAYILWFRLITYPWLENKFNKTTETKVLVIYYLIAVVFQVLYIYFCYVIYSYSREVAKGNFTILDIEPKVEDLDMSISDIYNKAGSTKIQMSETEAGVGNLNKLELDNPF